MDERLRKMEPQKVSLDGREFIAEPPRRSASTTKPWRHARRATSTRPAGLLGAFQRRYPASGYADSARFWLGNALYGKRDYKEAIAAFRAFVAGAPDHPRAPEALLAMANCQAEMKDTRGARKTLDDLIKAYPSPKPRRPASERLASLK